MPPRFDPWNRPEISLIHATSVPPRVDDFLTAIEIHRQFKQEVVANEDVRLVHTTQELVELTGDSMYVVLGLQHAPHDLTIDRMWSFRDAGVSIMAIAYDGPTEYGDGFKGTGGLTDKGKELVRWMAECGIIPDLSHAGHKTVHDVLELIYKEGLPVWPIASHSGCWDIFQHGRNLPANLLEGIAMAGGYVGIPAITFFLAPQGSSYLEEFATHVAHAIEVCGKGVVGIGSDCPHCSMSMDAAEVHFRRLTQMLKTKGAFGEYFPDRPPEIIRDGAQMFSIFERVLQQVGLPDECIADVMGGNFVHFLNNRP